MAIIDPRFVTVAEVRALSGVDSTLIDDSDMDEIISDIEYQTERTLNADLKPHVEIESRDGNNKPVMFTSRGPLLSLRALQIDGVDITIDTTTLDFKKSGKITILNNNQQRGTFTALRKKIFIKYVHGRVEWDKVTETTSSADVEQGTSVAIAVGDESSFATNDWVEIKSFDGNIETSQITGTASDEITVDQLVFDHISGATVRLMKIDPTILRYIKIWASIAAITRAVGQSFDEITGYTMGEFTVQKGEPFTQFREAIVRLEKQALWIQDRVRPTPGILV